MTFIKTTWKGLVFIGVLMGINALLFILTDPIFPQPIESTIVQLLSANLLLWFTLIFVLATKNRLITWLFNGLENVYATHRWLAIITVLMVVVHSQVSYLIIQYYRADVPFDPATMGLIALYMFIGITLIALLAKYMNYEHWRTIHRLMVIPYLFAAYHAFSLSSYALLSFTPLGIWMSGLIVIGFSSSMYMILLYRKTAFPYRGELVKKTILADDITELEIQMDEPFSFKPGQFAFIKLDASPFNGIPHPFSISGKGDQSIFFTIKALGDYTESIKEATQVGNTIHVSKPFGHMVFEAVDSPQVWIAGGIGITPFLGHLRSVDTLKHTVTLYYSVRSKKDAVHLDYLKSLDRKSDTFTLHFSVSDTDGFLTIDDINLDHHPAVFLCGPVPMAKSFKKQFRQTNKHKSLNYEAFSFAGTLVQDLVQTVKKLRQKKT